MNDCALIQQATGTHALMLHLTEGVHRDYCNRHAIDYYASDYPIPEVESAGFHFWQKVHLLRLFSGLDTELCREYKHLIWLDSDCLIVGDEDLRVACPDNGLGMTWHELEWGTLAAKGCYDHYNAGAIYLTNTPDTRDLLRRWWEYPVTEHPWGDQHALNMLLRDYPQMVTRLPHRWNSCPPYFEWDTKDRFYLKGDKEEWVLPHGEVVRSWHGMFNPDERLELIASAVEDLRAGGPGHESACLRDKIARDERLREERHGLRRKR